MRAVLYKDDSIAQGADITRLVATIELSGKQDAEVSLIHEACKRHRQAVAQGLIQRLRDGCEMFYGADDILAASGIIVEDSVLLEIALSSQTRIDSRADAAASVLGPASVGKLIDVKLSIFRDLKKLPRTEEGLSNRFYGLRDRIAHTPGASLITAVSERAESATNEDIQVLAELLCRPEEKDKDSRPFPQGANVMVEQMCRHWCAQQLAGVDNTTREQLSTLARLIGHFPSITLLPLLRQLLDEELNRYQAFHRQAEVERWRGNATNEARRNYTNIYQQAFTAIVSPETTALMISYLPNEDFGETAAIVLKVQWILANEPKGNHHFLTYIDFSNVKELRAVRACGVPSTCDEAEAIFGVIAPLMAAYAAEAQKRHAVALAIQAVRLPHGKRTEIIALLLSTAPQTARAKLLLNLVLSGEIISFKLVQAGINELLEQAETRRWILEEGWQLKAWLLLLPFIDDIQQIADTIALLPERQREPRFLEEMISATESLQGTEIEEALFKLAENDSSFYRNHVWRSAVRQRGTLTSARGYLDLIIEDKIDSLDRWQILQEIAALLKLHSGLQDYVYNLLRDGTMPQIALLAGAVAEVNDSEGLLLVVELENKLQRSLISWRALQNAVTHNVPSEDWHGAYEVLPIPATNMRKKLFAMIKDGGVHDYAARALRQIDQIRDEYGLPENEPRHPDFTSGKPWPLLNSSFKTEKSTSDSDVTVIK